MRWTDVTAELKLKFKGFQTRDNQEAFGLQAERSFENDRHLLAQMGCGTGKSFVNAAAAYRRSILTGKPSAISTGTKALQDQYAAKDLPFLADNVIPGLRFAILKGRSNYVCLAKVDELQDAYLKRQILSSTDAEGFSGESADVPLPSDQQKLITTTSEECPGKKECPFGDVCFAERAKEKAKAAHIVVVNHAVLAADMAVKEAQEMMGVPEDKTSGIMPHTGGVVIDEGHEFVEFVTNALGGSVTAGSYGRISKELSNFFNDRHVTDKMNDRVTSLFNEVARQLRKRQDKRNKTMRADEDVLGVLATPIVSLVDELDEILRKVKGVKIHGDDKAMQKRKRLEKRIGSMMQKLTGLITADEDEMVRWIEEGEGKKGDSIGWAPLTVSEFLARNLFAKQPVLVTSATLALGKDFTFIANRLGVDDYDLIDGGTPFDFKRQARTFIPDIPVPAGRTQGEWRASAIAMSKELVRASNGRAMLLFTSRTGMEESYNAMAGMIMKMGHKVYKQGDLPNKVLAEKFGNDEHSVLFALKSFFTGVDFQGDALRLVILDKMPFPVPSDVVLSAQVELADKLSRSFQTNGFNTITVPLMALMILQIYGRLIRTTSDWGLVAILDSRLYGKQAKYYGSRIVKILPDAPIITDLDEAIDYLSKENAA